MIAAIVLELIAFALFSAIGFVFADRKDQPLFRRDLIDDAVYFLLGLLVYSKITGWIMASIHWPAGAALVGRWPLWLQAAVVLVVYDACQYALHRWFHGEALWRYHAVHHSAEEIDIFTSFRQHPVNFIVYAGAPTALLLLAGFSPAAFLALAPINFVMGALTHANLNWTWGPLRYVVASPMFHRWHHADLGTGRSCNYAPNFPIFDLMFGTFYMPKGERPKAYGFPDAPKGVHRQMLYPFVPDHQAAAPARDTLILNP
jgi:sterol desaturase/sphingolipid hydroxylase (fatty acid hydroxylase superfamily)